MCKKAYLDTAHWIDLAQGNGPVVDFEEAVSDGKVVPVLSYTHLLELAQQQEDGWRTVSLYIDRVRGMGKTLWAHPRHILEQAEVVEAFSRFCGVKPPRIQPFGDSLVETLPDDPREPVTEELKSEPVESHVEKISRHPAFTREYLSERAEVFPELRKGELRNPRQRILDHVPKLLPGSDLFVGESTRREFAEKVDIMELPAFSMCAAYNQGMSQMKGYQYSDYEDHLHLAAMAYCDVSFADGRTCEALKQGKSRILPTRNGQFRQWLATLQPLDRSSDIELPQSPTRPCQALHDLEPPSSQG